MCSCLNVQFSCGPMMTPSTAAGDRRQAKTKRGMCQRKNNLAVLSASKKIYIFIRGGPDQVQDSFKMPLKWVMGASRSP